MSAAKFSAIVEQGRSFIQQRVASERRSPTRLVPIASSAWPALRRRSSNVVVAVSTGTGSTSSSRSKAARQYAIALGELALSKNALEEVNRDMEMLGRILLNQPKVRDFLVSPVVRGGVKKAVLKQIAEEKGFHRLTLNLLCLMVDRRRTPILEAVIHSFGDVFLDLTNTAIVVVASAVQIPPERLDLIAEEAGRLMMIDQFDAASRKKINVKNVIDPSVVAGFVVRLGSKTVDLSVKGKLEAMAKELEKLPPMERPVEAQQADWIDTAEALH